MKIYTKTGDEGQTSLIGGTRVSKAHLRIHTYGTIDELNSWVGLLRDQDLDTETKSLLMAIQDHLFTMGSNFALDPSKSSSSRVSIPVLDIDTIKLLESAIDSMEGQLEPMTHFILPGGHQSVSFCHITRTVCRRVERFATELNENEPFDPVYLQYLNRLSDFLFVLARKLSKNLQAEEIKWIPKK